MHTITRIVRHTAIKRQMLVVTDAMRATSFGAEGETQVSVCICMSTNEYLCTMLIINSQGSSLMPTAGGKGTHVNNIHDRMY